MLNFLKKIFLKPFKITNKDWEKYFAIIREKRRERSSELIGNFSQKGFDYIFYELIENADTKIVLFIKNYESIFDLSKFIALKAKCERFSRMNYGTIDLYTFDSEKDLRFIELENEFKCFKYTALEVKNLDEIKKCSNFILVDSSSYWLEENFTTYARTNISNEDEILKACCCFHDYKKTSKMYDFIRDVERQIQ
jgi:hypothetical protein